MVNRSAFVWATRGAGTMKRVRTYPAVCVIFDQTGKILMLVENVGHLYDTPPEPTQELPLEVQRTAEQALFSSEQ